MCVTVGSILEGKVTVITKFGAFVDLGNGQTGLIHISEVADAYVKDVNDYLKENDLVKVKVVTIGQDGKVGLSIKQAIEKPAVRQSASASFNYHAKEEGFEDRLAKFMKDSNDKLVTLKRHQEGKKGR